MEEKRLKVGVVGCGGMGSGHLKNLKALESALDIRVSCVADVRPSCLKKAREICPNIQCYETGRELIEQSDADWIHICLPTYLHAEHGILAMEAGKDVFIEKPVCLKPEDMDLLLQTAQKTGRKVMVGQVVRWFPEYRYLKQVYDSGKYGALKSIVMRRTGGRPAWSFENWFMDMNRSGSVVMDLHIHDIDFLRYLIGEPDRVEARAAKFADGMPGQVLTILEYKDVFASVEGLWDISTTMPFSSYYRASFENATVEYDGLREQSKTVAVYPKEGDIFYPCAAAAEEEQDKDSQEGINVKVSGPYYDEDYYFADCLIKGKEIEIATLEEGIRSAKLGCRILSQVMGESR